MAGHGLSQSSRSSASKCKRCLLLRIKPHEPYPALAEICHEAFKEHRSALYNTNVPELKARVEEVLAMLSAFVDEASHLDEMTEVREELTCRSGSQLHVPHAGQLTLPIEELQRLSTQTLDCLLPLEKLLTSGKA